ncbi:MAG: hypothetical protein E7642_08555 [Ruminococcaceae bacterium]|nr:hypothetical protein [Oscillospiraceae bacterium]
MKKIFIFVLCMALFSALVACSSGKDTTPTDTNTPPADTEEPVESIPDGAVVLSVDAGCRVVYSTDYRDAASKIFDRISELDSRSYQQIGFYALGLDTKEQDEKFEIAVGKTNRPSSASAKKKTPTYLDYTVSIEENGIAVFSHSPERALEAAEHFCSCLSFIDGQVVYIPNSEGGIGSYTDYPADTIKLAGKDVSSFSLVYPSNASENELANVKRIADVIGRNSGAIVEIKDDSSDVSENEILVGNTSRQLSKNVYAELNAGEYLFELTEDERGASAIIAYSNPLTMGTLFEILVDSLNNEGRFPDNTSGKIKEDSMIVSKIPSLRDPCIVVHNDTYYAYGTGWVAYKNTSGSLGGEWKALGRVVTVPEDAADCYWAPEVHKYKDEFYMFTTYKSAKTGHRGCSIFKSPTPEGPFVEISNGHATPADWDSIDATLYIDEEGQPWMVFVHEWTSTDDGIGRMAAAKMSDDLTSLISEPIELFRADDPEWTNRQVTDGCWLYKCQNGELIMIWSNFANDGYCVGIARSDNGKVDGNWSQDKKLLYSKTLAGEYDGGHGMIFTSLNGQLYLSIHSPNSAADGRRETPVFIAIREENGTLVWDK